MAFQVQQLASRKVPMRNLRNNGIRNFNIKERMAEKHYKIWLRAAFYCQIF